MNGVVLKTVLALGGLAWVLILITSGTVHVDSSVQAGGMVHESGALWAPYGAAVTVAGLFVWLFDKLLWSRIPFRWIVKRPDLHGTWNGEIVSDWVNPDTKVASRPIPVFIAITQTASILYLRQFTTESESATLAASLLKDPDDADSVVVLYRNYPHLDVRHCSQIHLGGLHLRVTSDDTLEGDYWTDRKTVGRLTLKRVSRAKCRSFSDAQRIVAKPKK